MSIQEFAQALERGEVATEIAKLRDLPEPAAVREEIEWGWPQWLLQNREM